MPLPWVRLDANFATHDKIVGLIGERDGYRAAFVYCCALGWSGGQGTDGRIPKRVLPLLHGTERIAKLLVEHELWETVDGGKTYQIHNYAIRQELSVIAEAKRAAQALGGRKSRCRTNHGPDCGCWRNST